MIEHLDNPGIALENIKDFMGRNTKLILTTPNAWNIFTIPNHFRKVENVHPDHMFWPSKRTMDHLLKTHKFEIKFFKYVEFGGRNDKKTFKGKVFERSVLNWLQNHLRDTLFYILKRK